MTWGDKRRILPWKLGKRVYMAKNRRIGKEMTIYVDVILGFDCYYLMTLDDQKGRGWTLTNRKLKSLVEVATMCLGFLDDAEGANALWEWYDAYVKKHKWVGLYEEVADWLVMMEFLKEKAREIFK